MSFVRVNRAFPSRGGGKKIIKVKKRKTTTKQEWDCTVNDLTVLRATPEELVKRHESHKSKNHGLAQWELREKALKKKWKTQILDPSETIEKKKLTILKEVLFNHYQLNEVLEKSDHAIGVIKDLFGDAPRRRTGFPNITVAPDCDLETSRGPITQKRDPPTQLSILSESVMDSQALNEVDDSSNFTTSQNSMDGREVSVNIYSNISADRMLHLLKEENSMLESRLLEENQSELCTRPSALSLETPSKPSARPSLGETALNATAVVQKTRSRLKANEREESSHTPSIDHVLKPCPKNQKSAEMKGSNTCLQTLSFKVLSDMKRMDPPLQDHSSLDVLNQMIHEVEKEIGEYEQLTGRKVMTCQNRDGTTGFTLSMVNSLSRLVRYLKEGEMHLQKELDERKRLEEELIDHRMLIDALTGEILALRAETSSNQTQLQFQTIAADEQLMSLTRAFRDIPKVESTTIFHCQQDKNSRIIRSEVKSNELPSVVVPVSRPAHLVKPKESEESFAGEPVDHPQKPSQFDRPRKVSSLPSHLFQPAVMLSPPRQKSTQDVGRRDIHSRPTSSVVSSENQEALVYPEKAIPPNTSESKVDEYFRTNEQGSFTCVDGDVNNSARGPQFTSKPSKPSNSSSVCVDGQQTPDCITSRDGARPLFSAIGLNDEELMARIAELTLQNSILKAQLMKGKVNDPEAEPGQHQLTLVQETTEATTSPGPTTDPKDEALQTPETISSEDNLERRIAELNHQSAEARKKLLQLIDQQMQAASVSPPISPIPMQPSWSGNKGKTIQVSIPGHEPADSSLSYTLSPASMASRSGRSSSSFLSRSHSPGTPSDIPARRTPIALRPPVKNQGEDGWFALSSHMM